MPPGTIGFPDISQADARAQSVSVPVESDRKWNIHASSAHRFLDPATPLIPSDRERERKVSGFFFKVFLFFFSSFAFAPPPFSRCRDVPTCRSYRFFFFVFLFFTRLGMTLYSASKRTQRTDRYVCPSRTRPPKSPGSGSESSATCTKKRRNAHAAVILTKLSPRLHIHRRSRLLAAAHTGQNNSPQLRRQDKGTQRSTRYSDEQLMVGLKGWR